MKILFDIISLQDFHNGGEEYTRVILNELLKCHVEIYGVYDSQKRFLDNDWEILNQKIHLIDIQKESLAEIIKKNKIDKFFIGIGQRYFTYDLSNIDCPTVCTIHDLFDIDMFETKIKQIIYPKTFKDKIKEIIYDIIKKQPYNPIVEYSSLINFISKNNVTLLTDSEYSKFALKYYFPQLSNKSIEVLYPPEKKYKFDEEFEDPILKNLIQESLQYILVVNTNRITKNANLVKKVFPALKPYLPNLKLVMANSGQKKHEGDIIYLDYLSNNDIELLYKKAWCLVYSSVIEGFGYPPLEAMKFATPVVSSNVTSMPEVLNEGVLFFSPLYPADLFGKILELKDNYDIFKQKALSRSEQVKQRQQKDLKKIIDLILS